MEDSGRFDTFLKNGTGGPEQPGITLRDWFAGQAISQVYQIVVGLDEVAKEAYKIADEMLAERTRIR